MTLRHLPKLSVSRPAALAPSEPDGEVMTHWTAGLRSDNPSATNLISMLDVIGADGWTGDGVTANRIAAALRSITADEITVDLNSPGGDFFEGVAIYNLLREDPRKVTVRILGLAASAASVIAMAGDEVQIGRAGFLMLHNAWVVAIGNRHDLAAAAETMIPFDAAMAEVYAAKAGVDPDVAAAWMDAETWFSGAQAIDAGLADGFLTADVVETEASGNGPSALKRIDNLLAKQNISRSERRADRTELRGTQDAAAPVTPRADDDWAALARSLIQTLT
ncbi:head maturation protease, ClpP-related [Paracoccus yeei]|uniref:head maturation protease, ClpP-related n=1 Tax=Paracoccus yeei TaxID=147645 RepID=UPI001C8D5047|nr:head maturation protease, ClpP-related [Paracoccus yeei]MBY0138497.1 Clp protease ClpP [Paracoccus yeei]